jgi:hypothetical protein
MNKSMSKMTLVGMAVVVCLVTTSSILANDTEPMDSKKDLKEKSIKESTIDSFSLPTDISRQLEDANKARTKKLFSEALILIRANCLDKIELANNEIVKLNETKKEAKMPSKVADNKAEKKAAKPELDTDKLVDMANDIREAIESATVHYFKAGEILSNALDMFKEAGKPAKEWIAWAGTACSVKKVQAYNLVKIYKEFGNVSEFKGCSMRVLNILVHTSNELYKKIEEEAKSLAKKGKLDTRAVNKLVDSVKPASKQTKPATPAKQNTSKDTSKNTSKDSTTETIKASMHTSNEVGKNTSNEVGNETNSSENKNQGQAELGTSTDKAGQDGQLAELIKQNQELLKKIAELESKLAAKEEKPTRIATYLPQFEAKSPNLVLGIEADASKAEINKRYRSMAVIFNAKTCPRGAKALKAAKEAMLKTAKN